ncbi:MAG: hypothetical protein ACRD11_07465 [Terriglobia bacterium]
MGSLVFSQVGQQTSFLESGSFYAEFYGAAATGGAVADVASALGGLTEAGQTVGAAMETYAPGSVGAVTSFVGGLVGNAPQTVWGAAGALAAEGSDLAEEGESAAGWVWHHLLC